MNRQKLDWDESPHEATVMAARNRTIFNLTVNKSGGFATYTVVIPTRPDEVEEAWDQKEPWRPLTIPLCKTDTFIQSRAFYIKNVGCVIWHVDHRGPKDDTKPGDSLCFVPGVIYEPTSQNEGKLV